MSDTTNELSPLPGTWAHFATGLASHRTKVITLLVTLVVLVVGTVMGVNAWRDKSARLDKLEAIASTLGAQVTKIGADVTAQGQTVATTASMNKQVTDTMGKQLSDFMTNQNATSRALYTALGQIQQEIAKGATVKVASAPDGSFKDVPVVQTRTGGKPALAEVALTWSPTTQQLSPSWTNYREDFHPALGEWQKKDKGFTAAFQLTRDVFKDGKLVGTESIDMQSATATYNEQIAFPTAAPVVPRWSFMAGVGKDAAQGNKTVPVGVLGYRLSDHLSLHAGQVGNTTLAGVGFNFNLYK